MEKNSYECRAYESVDDGSPSWLVYIIIQHYLPIHLVYSF